MEDVISSNSFCEEKKTVQLHRSRVEFRRANRQSNALSSQDPAGSDETDKVVAFGLEDLGFESSRGRLTSPLGSPLLAATPFVKDDLYPYFINERH